MALSTDKWPRIDDKLRLFIAHVETGRTPPDWLLEFMADGAREFMRGGKPWQKSSGRKKAQPRWADSIAYMRHHEGGLTVDEIVLAMGAGDEDGTDRTRTLRRSIKRGAVVSEGIERMIVSEIIEAKFPDLPEKRRRECRARLIAALRRLEADEIEPGYE
jgi:hypothetical protein